MSLLRLPSRHRIIQELKEWAWVIGACALIFVLINVFTVRMRVNNISMQPTLESNDYVLLLRDMWVGQYQRGDIVIFDHEKDGILVKRVIGLPGEVIRARNDTILVNQEPLAEPYLDQRASFGYQGEWYIPDNALFLLGDNRGNSHDSHDFGPIAREHAVGKVILVFYPLNHLRLFIP